MLANIFMKMETQSQSVSFHCPIFQSVAVAYAKLNLFVCL